MSISPPVVVSLGHWSIFLCRRNIALLGLRLAVFYKGVGGILCLSRRVTL